MMELHLETRIGELLAKNRREGEGEARRDLVALQAGERCEKREVRLGGGLADPVRAVRPPSVPQHVGNVAVEYEGEAPGHGWDRRDSAAEARARGITSGSLAFAAG